MITGEAAGHRFVDGVCGCGRKFVDIQYCGMESVGQENIAHSGRLIGVEVPSIAALKAKSDALYETNVFGRRPQQAA